MNKQLFLLFFLFAEALQEKIYCNSQNKPDCSKIGPVCAWKY